MVLRNALEKKKKKKVVDLDNITGNIEGKIFAKLEFWA